MSQGFINLNKTKAKKQLTRYTNHQKFKTLLSETDTSIIFMVRDTTVQNLDISLFFDATGKCKKEIIQLTCDSCLFKFLNVALGRRYYKWKKLNEHQYLSKYSPRLLLQKHSDFSFSINRTDINRAQYQKMVEDL